MGEDNQPVKHLTNYKLPNSYTFLTSATMLTLFYMLLLAVSDLVADTTLIDSSLFTYVSTVNIIIMLAILLALYGIWKELSLCLLPLIVIQKAELERSWRAETIDDELDENILIHNLPSNIHNNH
ncbi:hypothetical protein DINM_021252 [Dirofilaria immitis]|nr:hypothetical protein [Dirofilaria immitis]